MDGHSAALHQHLQDLVRTVEAGSDRFPQSLVTLTKRLQIIVIQNDIHQYHLFGDSPPVLSTALPLATRSRSLLDTTTWDTWALFRSETHSQSVQKLLPSESTRKLQRSSPLMKNKSDRWKDDFKLIENILTLWMGSKVLIYRYVDEYSRWCDDRQTASLLVLVAGLRRLMELEDTDWIWNRRL